MVHGPILILLLMGTIASAEATDPGTPTSPLGVRQERVKRMMVDLEEKLLRLAKILETTEPQQAIRLVETLHTAKENRIEHRMALIARMLNQLDLEPAFAGQKEIVEELRHLMDILIRVESELDELQKQIDQLERWQEHIQQLIEQETQHKVESERVSDPDKAVRQMDDQTRHLQKLIEQQKKLLDRTTATRAKGVHGLGALAEAQRAVRVATQELAFEIGQDGSQAAGGGDRGEAPQSDRRVPTSQALPKAVKHQSFAEENLKQGRGKAGEANQSNALEHMRRALEELQKQRDRIVSLPPEHLEQMAGAQDNTADRTGQLIKEMADASQASSGRQQTGDTGRNSASDSGENSGEQSPGRNHVQQAKQSMHQASANLRRKGSEQAAGSQQEAIEQLRHAQDQIEQRLAQLREEIQEEVLAALEARFVEMLSRQKSLTKGTLELEQARVKRNWTRTQHLLCSNISQVENMLGAMAQRALDIIVDDGTTVVFPRVVQALRDDLAAASGLMDKQRTDLYTQLLQNGIEETLEQLIEALRRAQEQPPQQSQVGKQSRQGQQMPPPLVPESAELKLLRAVQLRVNRRTNLFDQGRADELDAALEQELLRIAQQQRQVATMADDMIEGLMSQ